LPIVARRNTPTVSGDATPSKLRRGPLLPTFLRRAGRALIGQGGQAASSFLLTIVVSRAVDPSVRGAFVLVTLVPQIGIYFVTLGLPGAVLRGVAADARQRPALLGISAIASLGGGLLLTAVTPLLMALTHVDSPPILLVLLGTTSLGWLIFAAWFAFGCEQFLFAGALRTAPILGAALAIVALNALGYTGLVAMFAPWAVLHAVVATGSAIYFVRRYGIERPGRTQTGEWVRYGIRYSGIQILNLITLRLDQFILGWLDTTAAVGLYSIGVSLSEGLLLATTAIGLVIFIDSAKGEEAARFTRKLTMTVVVSCGAAGLLALIAGPLVQLLFGERYDGAVALTRILAIGTPGLVIVRLMTNRLAGGGRPGRASIYALVTLAVTSGLDLLLIPAHGATGAAWASSIGYNVGGAAALLTMRWADVAGRPSVAVAATR
jgi:O-antigen/teichoic acid export membrane protein